MSYKTINTHSEKFIIMGVVYKVTVDFNKDIGFITHPTGKYNFTMEDYTEFKGDMKNFVKYTIKGKK